MNGNKSLSFIPLNVPMNNFRNREHPIAKDRKQSPGMLTPKLRTKSVLVLSRIYLLFVPADANATTTERTIFGVS